MQHFPFSIRPINISLICLPVVNNISMVLLKTIFKIILETIIQKANKTLILLVLKVI